jgi:BirA family biotin operon repressor/biotin-[acetyl-CoA-carboxylase] ligase
MNFDVTEMGAVASTMDDTKALAREGAADGTTLVASAMSAGRGQHGRNWHAPVGGWYASIIVRDVTDPQLLTLALGNAVADILEIAGADPQIKWVNDVLVDGKKVAGVLCEAESTGSDVDFIVAGIGINLNGSTADWPDGLDATSTTLETILGADTCIEDTQDIILQTIGNWIDKVRAGKGDDVIARTRERDFLLGKTIEVDGAKGTAGGIDAAGRLLVGAIAVQSGTVLIVN